MSAPPTELALEPSPLVRLALPALLAGGILIGLSGIWVRLSETGPIATGFYRLAVSVPVFWAVLLLFPARTDPAAPKATWREYMLLVWAGVFFTGDLATWHWGLMLTSVTNATLLANFVPIFVTLAAWLMFRQKPTRIFLVGLATTMIGAVILVGQGLSMRAETLPGDGLSLVTAMFYAAYLLTVARARAYFSTAMIMAWTAFVGSILLLPMAIFSGETVVPLTWFGWTIAIVIGLGSQVAGQGLIAFAVAHVPATFSAVALLVQPIAAAVFAWLILGEAIGINQYVGGVIILIGIVIARRGSQVS
ncbi:MAG: DMT family transporter [Alphaproteobacteria bacterium]